MADFDVTEELQDFLVTAGVGVRWDGLSATLPAIVLDPRNGAPAPRAIVGGPDGHEPGTVTLRATSVGRPHDLDYAIEETFVDVIVRSRTAAPGKRLQRQIRAVLLPTNAPGGARMVMIGALLVEYVTQFRADQALPYVDGTYMRVQSFRFGARRKALAGLPYAP